MTVTEAQGNKDLIKVDRRAVVHPKAKLAPGVSIGPYAVIHEHVSIGEGTEIGAHCVIEGHTTIGRDCKIFSGAVIGSIPQDLKFKGEQSRLIIGDRNKIREYVTINPGTEGGGGKTVVGSDCLFMAYSHVAHDCIIGNNVILANSVALAGHILIEDRAIVGGLVGVHQFVRIGKLAMIGGCSRVVQDVPPYATCVGYPAKIFGVNSEGLKRAQLPHETKDTLHRAFKVLFYSKHSLPRGIESVEKQFDGTPELDHLLGFLRQSKRGICKSSSHQPNGHSDDR